MVWGTVADRRVTPGEMHGYGGDRERLTASIAAQLGSAREARWIVEHAGVDGAQALADRRAGGEPLQYVLGRWPFRSLELQVDRRVLIPRPETEQVVEVAMGELARVTTEDGRGVGPGVAVDLGTGSGAIALSLAVEGMPDGSDRGNRSLVVWATDASSGALEVARANLDGLAGADPASASRVRLALGSWYAALPSSLVGQVDLVVSNPPYVAESEYEQLDPVVRNWEPRSALVAAQGTAGVPGTADIEAVVGGAPRWLRPCGALVVEIAPAQSRAVVDAARRAGFSSVDVSRDLAGRLRVLVARR